jgi:hypothetical protein
LELTWQALLARSQVAFLFYKGMQTSPRLLYLSFLLALVLSGEHRPPMVSYGERYPFAA